MARDEQSEDANAGWRPFTLKLPFADPEDAEHFLQGMIVARSNNSNEKIVEIIDGVNEMLTEWRRQKVLRQAKGTG